MPISARGNRSPSTLIPGRAKRPLATQVGFTLLELLVVISIMAIAAAGVSFALRDTASVQLDREAQRLAAMLESARAQSRLSGVPVRWRVVQGGFRFEGLPQQDREQPWLANTTQVLGPSVLVLGPEPIIDPQAVVLTSAAQPQRSLRVVTDGVHPFTVTAQSP